MRYLRRFISFRENLEVKDTDSADIQSSKEKINATDNFIKEYPTKSKQIDEIYKRLKDKPQDIDKEIENLLGKDPKSRNPFLVEYHKVAKLHFDVNKLTDEILMDQVKTEDYNKKIALATSQDLKKSIQQTIVDINLRIQDKKKKLADKQAEVLKAKSDLDKKMSSIRKENEDASKNLAEKEKK